MGDNASSSEQEGNNTLLLYCTILGFAAVSWLLWKFLLSPAPQRTASAAAGSDNTAAASTRSGTDAASTTVAARRSATGTTSSSAARRSSGATAAASSSSSSSLHSSKGGGDDDDAFSFGRPRHPPHFIPPRGWETNKYDASTCLLQGIVPFRSGPAAGYETRLQNRWNAKAATTATAAAAANNDDDDTPPKADLIVINRRERARIFARMFSASSAAGGGGGGGRPPNRGANIVVTVRHSDVSCSKLQKALFLLGTYYNLFLLIDGSSSGFAASGGGGAAASSSSTEIGGNEKETREFIDKLRSELLNRNTNRATNSNNNNNNDDEEEEEGDGDSKDTPEYKLNPRILPPHRIAFSSTPKGRVAFVRQLHGTELVVDCDAGVTKELERFGFRVVLVRVPPPENNKGDGDKGDVVSSSALGKFLIP